MAEPCTGIERSATESSNPVPAGNGPVTRAIVWRVGPCRMTKNAALHDLSGISPVHRFLSATSSKDERELD